MIRALSIYGKRVGRPVQLNLGDALAFGSLILVEFPESGDLATSNAASSKEAVWTRKDRLLAARPGPFRPPWSWSEPALRQNKAGSLR